MDKTKLDRLEAIATQHCQESYIDDDKLVVCIHGSYPDGRFETSLERCQSLSELLVILGY